MLIGFLFKISNNYKLIFFENKNFKKNILIGFENKIPQNNLEIFLHNTKTKNLDKYLDFDFSKIIYLKVKLSIKNKISFNDMIFYLDILNYKKLYSFLNKDFEEDFEKQYLKIEKFILKN